MESLNDASVQSASGQRVMKEYLESSEYVDWKSPDILKKAKELAHGSKDQEQVAKTCSVFVRDEIWIGAGTRGSARYQPIALYESE